MIFRGREGSVPFGGMFLEPNRQRVAFCVACHLDTYIIGVGTEGGFIKGNEINECLFHHLFYHILLLSLKSIDHKTTNSLSVCFILFYSTLSNSIFIIPLPRT